MKDVKINIKKPNLKNINLQAPRFRISKISIRSILLIIYKELYNFFTQPIGYIISGLFIITFIIVVFGINKYTQYGTNDFSVIFGYLAFLMVIAIPAITMGSISKEKQSGTIEFIMTRPIRVTEYILGKITGNSLIVFLLLALTLPFTISTVLIATTTSTISFDMGQILMQYIGAMTLGVALVSLGVAVSSTFKNEIAAFLTSVIASAILVILGSDLLRLPLTFDSLVERFGLNSHYQSIAKGVIDARDVIYFLAFIITFIVIAYYFIKKDKYPELHKDRISLRNVAVLLIVITLFVGYFGQQLVYRIDLTSSKIYTLSNSSVSTINQVKDLVTISYFKSSGLPLEFQSSLRTIDNLLQDYKSYSGGKLEVGYKDPNASTEIEAEANAAGLTPIQFSSQDTNSAQVVAGYLGLVIKYKDNQETLNLVDATSSTVISNPEYEITKIIRNLTNENLKKVAYVTNGTQGSSTSSTFSALNSELSKLYSLSDIELKAEEDIPSDIQVLIIAGSQSELEESLASKVKDFVNDGGSLLLLSNPYTVQDITQSPSANIGSLSNLFEEYGVVVNQDMVYDLESYYSVNLRGYLFPIPYPFWVIASTSNANIPIINNIDQLSVLWGASLNITKQPDYEYWDLIKTTSNANSESGSSISIAIDRQYQQKDSDSVKVLAEAIKNNNDGRVVIVGDWQFVSDNFGMSSQADNISFALSSIEWLSKEEGISSIKAKNRLPVRVVFIDNTNTTLIAASVLTPVLILAFIGFGQYIVRKRSLA